MTIEDPAGSIVPLEQVQEAALDMRKALLRASAAWQKKLGGASFPMSLGEVELRGSTHDKEELGHDTDLYTPITHLHDALVTL